MGRMSIINYKRKYSSYVKRIILKRSQNSYVQSWANFIHNIRLIIVQINRYILQTGISKNLKEQENTF